MSTDKLKPSSAEKENLLAPDEGNVRYWTQRILDTITLEEWAEINIETVIRELLTKDTHYAAAETQEVPSAKELLELYWENGGHLVGISAVREACMAHFKGLIYQARLANDRCANAMFDKEQAINREAEAIGRAVSAEQTADALRREVAAIKTRSEERKTKLVKIFNTILEGDGDA